MRPGKSPQTATTRPAASNAARAFDTASAAVFGCLTSSIRLEGSDSPSRNRAKPTTFEPSLPRVFASVDAQAFLAELDGDER